MPPGFGYPMAAWPGSPIQFGPAPGLIWGAIGRRIGALVLDGVFMLIAFVVAEVVAELFGVHYYWNAGYGEWSTVYSTGASLAYLSWFILLFAYHPTCWWAFQGTLGQRALGLRVVRGQDGASLGVGATTVRYVIWGLCTLFVIPALIAAIIANDSPQKRTWWDDAVGSVVVRRV
jgi:uncharacterized RDD family membrane protein YckC